MSSMQVSCWIANVSAIGRTDLGDDLRPELLLVLVERFLQLLRHALRKARSVDQVVSSKARRAAAIARSMSAGEASATGPMTASVAGLMLS